MFFEFFYENNPSFVIMTNGERKFVVHNLEFLKMYIAYYQYTTTYQVAMWVKEKAQQDRHSECPGD